MRNWLRSKGAVCVTCGAGIFGLAGLGAVEGMFDRAAWE